jgi:transcriptional repressor NF-X1
VASFEERICHCGHTIQYPPIRCATQPLDCPMPCARQHACEHPVSHNCHWDDNRCPPCSYLTSRMCMGEHELRHNIPCHMKDVSCGRPCMRRLESCAHKCNRTCHKGPCITLSASTVNQNANGSEATSSSVGELLLGEDALVEKCTQPCIRERPHCNHRCNALCHGRDEPCPDTVCQEMVTIRCKCGFKSECSLKIFIFF